MMCGRYAQTKSARQYAHYLRATSREEAEKPSWNIPPTASSLVARRLTQDTVVERLTWGFLGGGRLVSNARVETAAEKPLFRDAWRFSRCIVPVDGWYEWKAEDGPKQPFYFTPANGEPILLAGLVEGDRFLLITSETHGPLRAVHHRRPVALPLAAGADWLDPTTSWDADRLTGAQTPESDYLHITVDDRVNSTRNDGPGLIEKRAPAPQQARLAL